MEPSSEHLEPSTISGYPLEDAMDTLERSIEAGDAESACCMASELACTPMQVNALIASLVQMYAQWYVSVDMLTMTRIAKDVAALSALPGDPAARRALCDMVIGMSLALPRQNAFEVLSGRVKSPQTSQVDEPSAAAAAAAMDHSLLNMGNKPKASAAAAAAVPPAAASSMVALTSKLAGLMQHSSTEAVRLATQILTDMSARTTPAAAVTAAVCAMWDACKHAASDVPVCRDFVASAHQLFQVGCKKDMPPNKRTCVARRNLLLCAILVAAGSSAIRDGGSLPRCTWMSQRADATLKGALATIDAVFEEILNPPTDADADADADRPSLPSPLQLHQHQFQHQHQYNKQQHPGATATGGVGNGQSGGQSGGQPISYLRMYTTVDYQAAARTMDTIHQTRTELSDKGYMPKTIMLRTNGGGGGGGGGGANNTGVGGLRPAAAPERPKMRSRG